MNRINERNYDACIAVLNDAFDNFDFEKVKRVMDAVDWKWSDLNEADGSKATRVPTVDDIKAYAADLMWRCANDDIDCIACGGFRVEKDFTIDDDPWIHLSFVVEEWDVTYSELD